MGAGRHKIYTPKQLEKAVDRYFKSITRKKKVTERVASGERDDKGHVIYIDVPVKNELGKEVEVIEYIVPPEMSALYDFLKISKSTWSNYSDAEKNPEMQEVTQMVYERMKAWNEHEMLVRPGKDLKGIEFNLTHNYGYRDQLDVNLSGNVEDLIAKLAEEGERSQL